MNKYFLSASLIVSAFYGLQSSVVYAMEPADVVTPEPSQKNPTIKYANFAGLSDEQYIARCMPKLNNDQKKAALRTFNSLRLDGYAPIKEDGLGNGADNNGKVLPEGGYSFPPVKQIQGPFLEYCGTAHGSVFLMLELEMEMIPFLCFQLLIPKLSQSIFIKTN
jgi:hypothetical protein